MKVMQYPRMQRRDVESMVRIHTAIAAAHQTLRRSNYEGRALVINVLETCDVLVTELFNRCEAMFVGAAAPAAPAELVNDQSVRTASVEVNGNLDPNHSGQERV
jgi:hypothetical protein